MSTRQLTAMGVTLVLGVLVLGALAIAGSRYIPVRTFSVGAPNGARVAIVRRGRSICEGDIVSQGRFDEVGLFGNSATLVTPLQVSVIDSASGHVVSRGTEYPATYPVEFFVMLDNPVTAVGKLRVCLSNRSRTGFALLGSTTGTPATAMTGGHGVEQFSLVLRRSGGASFLSSLSLALRRASLWRPQWVGPWVYWALLALLLAGIPAVTFAVASADGDDEAAEAAQAQAARGGDARPGDQAPSSADAQRQ